MCNCSIVVTELDLIKWDKRFLSLAKNVATWSKDPSTQVGAVVTLGKYIVSLGFNGMAQGVVDEDFLTDRDLKLKTIIHGEINAILSAKRDLNGCTLYTWPLMPCSNCASVIIQAGIKRVVAPITDNPRWKDSIYLSMRLFEQAGITTQPYPAEEIK